MGFGQQSVRVSQPLGEDLHNFYDEIESVAHEFQKIIPDNANDRCLINGLNSGGTAFSVDKGKFTQNFTGSKGNQDGLFTLIE